MYSWKIGVVGLLALGACEQSVSVAPRAPGGVAPAAPGIAAPVQLDRIVQVDSPEVDVLWVIDDSCSMSEEQAALAREMPRFMQFFIGSGLDYHIGVVTTDMQNPSKSGRLQQAFGYRWVDSEQDEDLQLSMFSELAVQGTGGSPIETGRRAAYRALTEPLISGHNDGFYRDAATMSIIVVTDEDDDSGNAPNRNEFIRFLLALKDTDEKVSFSHISGDLPNGCTGPGGSADPAREYHAVTNAVGGTWYSICEADWAPLLEGLGLEAAGLKREYFLSDAPVPSSIEVWVEDEGFVWEGVNAVNLTEAQRDAEDGWRDVCETNTCFLFDYDERRNSILIEEFVPGPLAEIYVRYTVQREAQPQAPELPPTDED